MILIDLISAFHKGQELANGDVWKDRTKLTNRLTLFLVASVGIAKGLGYDLDVNEEVLAAVAAGVAALLVVINGVVRVATDPNVGLPARRETPPGDGPEPPIPPAGG